MAQLYDKFADEQALEAQKEKVLALFEEIKQGVKSLSSLGITLDNSKSKKEVDELLKATERLKNLQGDYGKQLAVVKLQQQEVNKANKEAAKDALGLNDAYAKLSKQYEAAARKAQNLAVTLGKDAAETKKAAAEAKLLGDQLKETDAAVGKFQRNVGNYANSLAGGFDKVSAEIKRVSEERKRLEDQFKNRPPIPGFQTAAQLGDQSKIKELTAALQQLEQVQQTAFNTTGSATKQVRGLENAYIALATSGTQSTEFLREFKDEIGKAKDDVRDLRESINLAASDTRGLDVLIGGAQAVAGAFGVAQGITAVFGDDNEELQKTLVKLNGVMTILNGLQAIQNELKKKDNIVTVAQIGLQKAYTFVIGTSTGALKAFRIALAATGVGLLIIGLAALISKMSSLGSAAKDTTLDIQGLAFAIDDLNFTSNIALKNLQNQNALALAGLKARGASEKQLNAAKISGLQEEKKLLDGVVKSSIAEYNASGLRLGAIKKESDAVDELRLARASESEFTDKTKESVKKNNAARIAALEKIVAATDEAKGKQIEIDIEGIEASGKLRDKALEKFKKDKEKEAEIAKRNADAIFEIEKLGIESRIRLAERTINDEQANDDEKIKSVADFIKAKSDLIEAEAQHEKSEKGKTEKEIEAIETKKQDALSQLTIEGEDKRAAITKNAAEKVKAFFEKLAADAAAHRSAESENNLQRLQNEFDSAILALDARKRKGLISEEDYNEEKLKLQEAFFQKSLAENIRYTQAVLDTAKARALASGSQQDIDAVIAAQNKLDALVISSNRHQLDNTIKTEQGKYDDKVKKLEQYAAIAKEVFDIIGGFAQAATDRELNRIQEEIDLLEKKKQKEIEVVNQSIGSAEEKAAKIKIIEARAEAQRQQLELKKRQAQEKQARFDKASTIANIIMETALAVVRALGSKPYTPANIALAAITGAIGAAQLAVAIATPIPKFFKGTDHSPEGLAEVAEQGPELAIDPGGKAKVYDKHTLTYLSRGTKIFPADVTKAMIAAAEIDRSGMMKSFHNNVNVSVPDNRDLLETTVRELKELNKKSRIVIQNNTPIETTAWYWQNMKH